jgi:hypothetical protein
VTSARKLISMRRTTSWPRSAVIRRCLRRGAEVGEGEAGGAGGFDSGGEDGGRELEDEAELDLDAELHGGGRRPRPPQSAKQVLEQDGGVLLVAEAPDVERLHVGSPPQFGVFLLMLCGFRLPLLHRRGRGWASWRPRRGVT